MRIGAVIAAAGMSTRMDEFAGMAKADELTMAERVVLNFQRAGVKDIVIVTGYQAERMEKKLQHYGATFLRNESYGTAQMIDSAKIGMAYLQGRCDRVLFCPVDVSFFKTETVKKVLEQEGPFVVPVYQGKSGHPVCIDDTLIPMILNYQGKRGIKGALYSCDIRPVKVDVDDEGALSAIDTPEGYQHLVELHNSSLIHPRIKTQLAGTKPFFGPGAVTLLKQIDRLGSVREACEKTGISYSKGWSIIRTAEKELGYRIVERAPGGKNGGEAYITARGQRLLDLYETYVARVEQTAKDIFEQIFLNSELF